jgi:hypothetical protein
MTEQEFRDKYYADAREQTLETLPAFFEKMLSESHDYGSICCAIGASAVAAAWAANRHENAGINKVQTGCVMWEFVRQWNFSGNKTGLKIIDYDDLLYPQNEDRFRKVISAALFKKLQGIAAEKIKEGQAHPTVIDHWRSIVAGVVPFGFTLED